MCYWLYRDSLPARRQSTIQVAYKNTRGLNDQFEFECRIGGRYA